MLRFILNLIRKPLDHVSDDEPHSDYTPPAWADIDRAFDVIARQHGLPIGRRTFSDLTITNLPTASSRVGNLGRRGAAGIDPNPYGSSGAGGDISSLHSTEPSAEARQDHA